MSKDLKNRFSILLVLLTFITLLHGGIIYAATDDVLLGAVSSGTALDPGTINSDNFSDTFIYNGSSTTSYTIEGAENGAQIGAIWTGGSTGDWRQIRVVIDTNKNGVFEPFDWSDSNHPWNKTTGTWTYPEGYPGETYDNGNNDGTIDFDSGESFPWDYFEFWWYESQFDFDKTESWWMEAGQLMNIFWEGRDQNWNILPNGDYMIKVWVDENDDGAFTTDEANKVMIITITTASITGTVKDESNNPVEGAEVEAGSYLAWGNARTGADGQFTISGLQAGASYHVRVQAPGKVTSEKEVNLPAGEITASADVITMNNAITITGTLKLDRDADGQYDETEDQFAAFINQWGWEQNEMEVWIDGWNKQGPGWGNGNARFNTGDSSISFSINIPPPSGTVTYQLNVHAEGYASSPVDVEVTANGGNAGTIVLTKASILTGSVKLPAVVDEWLNIDVQAINTLNNDDRYWGWGNIDPQGDVTDTGEYRIDGIPAGTYTLEVRVMGYAVSVVEEVIITQGADKEVPQINVSRGSTISGTLTVQGDTTQLLRWQGDDTSSPLDIWIDAWSPSSGGSGTNISITRGTDQTVEYTIGGLSDGTYEINTWIGEGYELVDSDGNAPVSVTVSGDATRNILLKPFEGVIQGTITGPDGLDLNNVVVEVKRPWDWLPPKIATVANGKINSSTGEYSISGLGTGDYVVKAGMYLGYMDYSGNDHNEFSGYNGEGWLLPSTAIGILTQRTFVQNNADSPTTLNIGLSEGYSISGSVALSTTDAPWHDFGNGTFTNGIPGDPDDIKNIDADPMLSEVISMDEDVVGQPVMAMPMEMMFMGGEDPRMGMIMPDGTYRIDGLSPGVYIVMPPFSSERIEMMERMKSSGSNDQTYDEGEGDTHHWTVTSHMVVITDSNIADKNFTLGNGYTITGKVTMPEAQTVTQDWETYQWIGQLELETPSSGNMGHSKTVFKGDFNNSNKYDFKFNHVANGEYLVRFWTDNYVPGSAKVTINNGNTSTNITVEEGANLIGKLVDADTGEAVTAKDGIRVVCEAFPHVEGSWRETRNDDPWSKSYIEDDSGLRSTGSTGDGQEERENKTPGKFHLTAIKTGYQYVIYVEAENGIKTQGAKNYVGRVIAGIDVPENATGDIDVGTIKLKQGTTIKGRLTDANGNPVPGVDVVAIPSDTNDGTAEAHGTSDTQGYYTIYGIDPDVGYYDLIAAERPFMFDDWGKKVEWGEKRKYNVLPRTADANFLLKKATATLSGTITIPESADFMLPFKGEGEEFPATYILMQRKGVVYKDLLEGAEGMTTPSPGDATTATYAIDNIEPGTYRIIYMNYGLPTKVFDNIVIEAGNNVKDVTWETTGYTVSGTCTLDTGGYPGSSDISGVVCMNTSDQSLIFGVLTQEPDGTYSSYEVPGLADGEQYQLTFYQDTGMDDMPDVFPVGAPFTATGDDTVNATISRNNVPILMVQVAQDLTDDNKFNIGIFSTTYLVDKTISAVSTEPTSATTGGEIYIRNGDGTLNTPVLSGDKRNISVSYTRAEGDDNVELILAVHYGDDSITKLQTITFNVNSVATNGDVVNTYMSGQVKLGGGDASQIYIPAGAVETSDQGKLLVTIEKTNEEPGSASDNDVGIFSDAVATALPGTVETTGNLYDFSVAAANDDATASINSTITVQVEYDPAVVTDPDELNIWHLVDGVWVMEDTNRTVDEENHTISVEVTSLSPFVTGLGGSSSDSTDSTDSSGTSDSTDLSGSADAAGGGGGCFITSAGSNSTAGYSAVILQLSLLFAFIWLLMFIRLRKGKLTIK